MPQVGKGSFEPKGTKDRRAARSTSSLVQLGSTLTALGAQLVNSVVDCAV